MAKTNKKTTADSEEKQIPKNTYKTISSLREKASPKKAAKKAAKKIGKAAAVKKVARRPLSEKEEQEKEANRLINSSPKKKGSKKPIKVRSGSENSGLLDAIVEGMQEKKANNIVVLNLSELDNRVCDYFVVCDAESRTQVEAIADSVEDMVAKKIGEKAFQSEGHGVAEWILVDYVNIVAHIFQREVRDYYAIEDLWADAEINKID